MFGLGWVGHSILCSKYLQICCMALLSELVYYAHGCNAIVLKLCLLKYVSVCNMRSLGRLAGGCCLQPPRDCQTQTLCYGRVM